VRQHHPRPLTPTLTRKEEAQVDLTDSPPRTASAPRVVGWLALAGVSLIAGIASYFHALAVVQAAGATVPVAYLVPALADLVILGASADMIAAYRSGQPRPALTMTALGVGIAVTLAMNIAAGSHHGLGGRLVSGWPALAFTLALESLAGLVRRGRGGDHPPVPAAYGHAEPPEPVTTETALAALLATASERVLAEVLDVPRSRVQTWKRQQAEVAAEPSPELSLNGASS
jgi:hypothetical protein